VSFSKGFFIGVGRDEYRLEGSYLTAFSKWERVPELLGFRERSARLIQEQITHSIHIFAH
jgi:hypothetical protein